MNELTGFIHVVYEPKTYGNYTKREFVIKIPVSYKDKETNKKKTFNKFVLMEMAKKSMDLLDNIAIGTKVTCTIDVGGREWTNKEGVVKYFNSIMCWKIDLEPETQGKIFDDKKEEKKEVLSNDTEGNTTEDDLPF